MYFKSLYLFPQGISRENNRLREALRIFVGRPFNKIHIHMYAKKVNIQIFLTDMSKSSGLAELILEFSVHWISEGTMKRPVLIIFFGIKQCH